MRLQPVTALKSLPSRSRSPLETAAIGGVITYPPIVRASRLTSANYTVRY
jgi:hypothetical protein